MQGKVGQGLAWHGPAMQVNLGMFGKGPHISQGGAGLGRAWPRGEGQGKGHGHDVKRPEYFSRQGTTGKSGAWLGWARGHEQARKRLKFS